MLELISLILIIKYFNFIMKSILFIITAIITCAILTAFINQIILT